MKLSDIKDKSGYYWVLVERDYVCGHTFKPSEKVTGPYKTDYDVGYAAGEYAAATGDPYQYASAEYKQGYRDSYEGKGKSN